MELPSDEFVVIDVAAIIDTTVKLGIRAEDAVGLPSPVHVAAGCHVRAFCAVYEGVTLERDVYVEEYTRIGPKSYIDLAK